MTEVDDRDVERILKVAEAAGDQALAHDLQALRPHPLVAPWVKIATDLSSDDLTSDLPKALRAAGSSPGSASERLGKIAQGLAQRLFSLRGLACDPEP